MSINKITGESPQVPNSPEQPPTPSNDSVGTIAQQLLPPGDSPPGLRPERQLSVSRRPVIGQQRTKKIAQQQQISPKMRREVLSKKYRAIECHQVKSPLAKLKATILVRTKDYALLNIKGTTHLVKKAALSNITNDFEQFKKDVENPNSNNQEAINFRQHRMLRQELTKKTIAKIDRALNKEGWIEGTVKTKSRMDLPSEKKTTIIAGREGDQISLFVVQKFMGEGSFSRVVGARDLATDNGQLDIFKQPVNLENVEAWQEDNQKEQQILKRLESVPGIQRPHHEIVNYKNGQSGFVHAAAYAGSGEDKRIEKLSLSEKLHAFKNLGSALEAMEDKKVHHGDIKPPNLLFEEDQSGKIDFVFADFGGSRIIQDNQLSGVTHTPIYRHPQITTRDSFDANWQTADAYALALTMLVVLAGINTEDIDFGLKAGSGLVHDIFFNSSSPDVEALFEQLEEEISNDPSADPLGHFYQGAVIDAVQGMMTSTLDNGAQKRTALIDALARLP